MKKFSVIDLFAGAGGLSLGFEQTNKYDIKVAFENNPQMRKTYSRNHPDVDLREDVCEADYEDIQRKYGKIDVVIGGPPCQGFSNANRQQKNHAVSKNNKLVKQYIRAITELQPKAFVMENVSMLKSDVHRFYLEKSDVPVVKKYNVPKKLSVLHLLDAQYYFDGVKDIIQDQSEIKSRLWPDSTYSEINIILKNSSNEKKLKDALEKHKKHLLKISGSFYSPANDNILKSSNRAFAAIRYYYSGFADTEELIKWITPAVMFQRMLSKGMELFENNLIVEKYTTEKGLAAEIYSFAVFDYLKAILTAEQNNYVIASKVLCAADYGAPQKRMRFVVVGIKRDISETIALPSGYIKEANYAKVTDAISDLENVPVFYDISEDRGIPLNDDPVASILGQSLRDSKMLYNHVTTRTTETAMARFLALQQGENFHALKEELKSNTYTNADRTQNTIYLRLNYEEPSGTVVNVRKSMWIHPVLNRAISIREAARLQTFPDSFVFCGTKDSQYQQVGNAVPPRMAKAIAKKLAKILIKGLKAKEAKDG